MDLRLEALRADFAQAEVLYRRADRIVIRRREAAPQDPVIVKMWSRPDLRGVLRRILGIASHQREWRTLVRLRSVNMSVPRPLGCCRVIPSIAGYTDALFMEDLGDCEAATDYLKR